MATDSLNHPSARNSKKNKNKKHRNWKQTDDGNGLKLKTVVQRIALKLYSPQTHPATFPTCNRDNMARSKDKKKDAENGEADETKDDSRIDEPTMDYEELVKRVCVIAKPLASRKLTKRLYKTVKKGKRGVYLYGLMA